MKLNVSVAVLIESNTVFFFFYRNGNGKPSGNKNSRGDVHGGTLISCKLLAEGILNVFLDTAVLSISKKGEY